MALQVVQNHKFWYVVRDIFNDEKITILKPPQPLHVRTGLRLKVCSMTSPIVVVVVVVIVVVVVVLVVGWR